MQKAAYDIVNVYQSVGSGPKSPMHYESKRQQLWYSLRQLLNKLPDRNSVIVLGDFNTQCEECHPFIGPCLYNASSDRDNDWVFLKDIICDFKLCLANSWSRGCGPTYVSEAGCSHIDHIFIKGDAADATAKCAKALSCDFFPWRDGGKHLPVEVSLPRLQKRYSALPQRVAAWDTKSMIHDYLHDPQATERFQHRLDSKLAGAPATAEALNQALAECCAELYPAVPRPLPAPQPWRSSDGTMAIRAMWDKYRAFKRHRPVGLFSILQVWRDFACFKSAHRAMKKKGSQLRRQRQKDKLLEAEKAVEAGQTHQLYSVVRQLAPKQVRRKIKLRSPEGDLLDGQGEMAVLLDHCSDVFSASAPDETVYSVDSLKEYTSQADLLRNLKQTPLRKAAPPNAVPAVAWKLAGEEGCLALNIILQELHHEIPQPWKDAWLAMIPKVACPRVPRDLRPIGLQDIGGKCVMGALRDAILPFTLKYADSWPQYAYLWGRSTKQPICKAFEHCAAVRDALQRKTTLHERRQGVMPVN